MVIIKHMPPLESTNSVFIVVGLQFCSSEHSFAQKFPMVLIINFYVWLSRKWVLSRHIFIYETAIDCSSMFECQSMFRLLVSVILHTCIHRNSCFLNVTRFLLLNKSTKMTYAEIVLHGKIFIMYIWSN